jgi:hypothetical protein
LVCATRRRYAQRDARSHASLEPSAREIDLASASPNGAASRTRRARDASARAASHLLSPR